MRPLLRLLCKQGILEISRDTIRVLASFRKPIWSVERSSVIDITAQPDAAGTVTVTIHAFQGRCYRCYQAEAVLQTNIKKLQTLFPTFSIETDR